MDRLYKYYIEQIGGYDMLDVLEAFSGIYARLGIDTDLIGPIDSYDTSNDISNYLKEGIIKAAIDNNIIPQSWHIGIWFYLDGDFKCIPPKYADYTKEEIEKIIDDFNKWTGLNIEIKWK